MKLIHIVIQSSFANFSILAYFSLVVFKCVRICLLLVAEVISLNLVQLLVRICRCV